MQIYKYFTYIEIIFTNCAIFPTTQSTERSPKKNPADWRDSYFACVQFADKEDSYMGSTSCSSTS